MKLSFFPALFFATCAFGVKLPDGPFFTAPRFIPPQVAITNTSINPGPEAEAALKDYKHILELANRPPAGVLSRRQCDINDVCCPDGVDSCIDDLCSLGDGFPAVGCILGCCTACGGC